MSEQQKIIQPQAGFQERFVRSNVDVAIGGGVLSCGKAQPLYAKVLTPCGFVQMGDLSVGQIISGANGKSQKVEQIYDRGELNCYKVVLDDGSTTHCCDEHLWDVFDSKTKEQVVLELKSIMQKPTRYLLNRCKPIEFDDVEELRIHPYLLGALLGDATLGGGKSTIRLFTDHEIVDSAYSLSPFDYVWHRPKDRMSYVTITETSIRRALEYYNLIGTRSHNKFIPPQYLYSSIENRIELLRGLFDTDGYNDKASYRVEYTTVSEQLCKDVVFLVRSLGGKVSVSTKIGSYRDREGGQVLCKKAYRISCRLENRNYYFRLSRKKVDGKQKRRLYAKFKSIEYVGKEEMRCIKVSNKDHLYITDDFIVTHNTAGAVLAMAEPTLDPQFRAVFLRNNLGDLKSGGGILDEFRNIYGSKGCSVIESGDPHVDFPSGARVDVTHIADQSYDKVMQRFKGRQYDCIYFDEMTGFTWECFSAVCTRNRGKSKKWTGKIRGTTNPDRDHWLRTFLDWYIGIDGFIREDREGVVRYFFVDGESVKDVVWGDSKEEVYCKCKIQIDRKVRKVDDGTGSVSYKDFIQSFTFYLGRMSENKAILGENSGYVGAVAMAGGRSAEQLLEGNWNVSVKDALDAPIPSDMANQVFVNDPCVNGDRWVTCDLADTGTDNFLCLAWDGFHVIDSLILGKTTPRQNAEQLQMFAEHHDVSDSHIIYDAIRGTYINDYIPDAIPFFSYAHPMGVYGRMARQLKDECYMRLIEMIKRGDLSISEKVGTRIYEHQKLKENITIQNEFIEECAVVRFKEVQNGKKTLLSKREMNQKLGKGRSMDLLDPCAMRMLPVLHLPYGDERIGSAIDDDDEDEETDAWGQPNSIYEDSTWC